MSFEPQYEYADLPLSEIRRDGTWQFRATLDGNKIKELAESIEANGQQTPVTVRKMPDGAKVLLSGHRRTAALMALGHKTVKAMVWSNMTDEQAVKFALDENLQRESLSDLEQVQAALRLNESGMSTKKVAEAFHVDPRTIQRYYIVAKAPKEFQAALEEGKTTIIKVHDAIKGGLTLAQLLEGGQRGRSVRFLKSIAGAGKGKGASRPATWREAADGTLHFSLRFQRGTHDIKQSIEEVKKLLKKLQSIEKQA